MLTEIIRIKLDKLYSELDKLSRENDVSDLDTLEEISIKCEDFLSILAESRSNITTLNTDDMTDILIKYGNNPYDKKEVSDKFKYIKLVYLGIDRGLDISISDTQEAFLESYITNVMQVVKNIRSTINEKNDKKNELQSKIDELRDFIIELEALLDKINDQNNEEVLDANDFNTFYKIVEDDEISNDIKMQGLIEFRRYNIMRANKEKKTISKVSIEDIRNCFIEHGFSEKQLRIVDKFKDEIERNAKIDNIRNILNYMESKNILRRFAFSDLLTITLYGTLDSVKNRYEILENDDKLYPIFFDTAFVWINNVSSSKKRTYNKSKDKTSSNNKNYIKSLKCTAHTASYEDLIQNERFLRSKGLNVSLSDQNGCSKILRMPHKQLLENFDVVCKYGICDGKKIDFPLTILSSVSGLTDKLDSFIEVGLLGDSEKQGEEFGNYIKIHGGSINHINSRLYPVLYKMRRDMDTRDYYNLLFSSSRYGCLKKEFTSDMFGLGIENDEVFSKYLKDNFIAPSSYLGDTTMYDSIINSDIEPSREVIKDLDNRFMDKDNPLIYRIGNNVISRNKVIKNYGKLVSSKIELNNDALMYSIVRGSYLNMDEVKAIASDIGYTLEGEMNL